MRNFLRIAAISFFLAPLLFCAVIFLGSDAHASNDLEDIKRYTSGLGDHVIKIASDEALTIDDRRRALIRLTDENVDTDWISRFILGKYSRQITADDKARFTRLYRNYMIQTYAQRFQGYNGEKFRVINVVDQEDGDYIAQSEFISADGIAVSMDFWVNKDQDSGRKTVRDIIIEGVSFIGTQRSEFTSFISRNGFEALLASLEDRTKKSAIAKNGK